MTNKDYVISQLEANIRERGENAFSTQMLKRQLRSMEWAERNIPPSPTHNFHIGARGEYQLPSTPQKAEAEAEERQEEESANRGRPSSALKGPPPSQDSATP